MIKRLSILCVLLLSLSSAYSDIHYPKASQNPIAQHLFDTGMLNYYAYLYSQAEYDFKKATEKDSHCGLCYFGLAIAKRQQALELSEPLKGLAEFKKAASLIQTKDGFYWDLIQAGSSAFSPDANVSMQESQKNYIKALKQLYGQYKDDRTFNLEALALYVDAIAYYHSSDESGNNHCSLQVNEDLKEEAIKALKPVLSDSYYPPHPGLIHTYIHLTERNTHDPLGLKLAAILPTFSHGLIAHYTHMPNHIYWRRGLYDKAIEANREAIAVDKNYFKHQGVGRDTYYYEYHYLHSYHFLTILGILTNDYSLALKEAQTIKRLMNVKRIENLKDYRDVFFSLEHLVLARFEKWQEVLELQTPPETQELGQLLIRFSKALAYLKLGQKEDFEQSLLEIKNEDYQRNNLRQLKTLVETYLQASKMAGQKKSLKEIERFFLEKKVDGIEGKLFVMNPPLWVFPYQLLLSDTAFERGDYKAALEHHRRFENMYPHSKLGKYAGRE